MKGPHYQTVLRRHQVFELVPVPGTDPGTYRLSSDCSTTELDRHVDPGLMGKAVLGPFEGYPAQQLRSWRTRRGSGGPEGFRSLVCRLTTGCSPIELQNHFDVADDRAVCVGAPGLESNCRPSLYKGAALPLSYRGKNVTGLFRCSGDLWWEVWWGIRASIPFLLVESQVS